MQNPEEEDLDIRLGLIGTAAEVEAALRLVYERYKIRVAGFIRSQAPTLDSGVLADITQETFACLYAASRGSNFDVEQPLLPLLFTIAKRRAIDELRKHKRTIRDQEAFALATADYLASTDQGYYWRQAISEGRAVEIRRAFRAFVQTLPTVQRRIAQGIADHLPDDLRDSEIAEIVYKQCGERPTVVQIKSAKAQLRMKFKEILTRMKNQGRL